MSTDNANIFIKRKSSGKLRTGRAEMRDNSSKEPQTEYKNPHIIFDSKNSDENEINEEIRNSYEPFAQQTVITINKSIVNFPRYSIMPKVKSNRLKNMIKKNLATSHDYESSHKTYYNYIKSLMN